MEDRIKSACQKVAERIGTPVSDMGSRIEASFGPLGEDWVWTIRCQVRQSKRHNPTSCSGFGDTPEEAAEKCVEDINATHALWEDQARRRG